MDTDELSNEAYKGIFIEAESFSHDLTLQFGSIASDCKDEEDYLQKATQLINEIRSLDKDELAEVFFGNLPDIKLLNSTLDRILIILNK
jgi:hypothetical protein